MKGYNPGVNYSPKFSFLEYGFRSRTKGAFYVDRHLSFFDLLGRIFHARGGTRVGHGQVTTEDRPQLHSTDLSFCKIAALRSKRDTRHDSNLGDFFGCGQELIDRLNCLPLPCCAGLQCFCLRLRPLCRRSFAANSSVLSDSWNTYVERE